MIRKSVINAGGQLAMGPGDAFIRVFPGMPSEGQDTVYNVDHTSFQEIKDELDNTDENDLAVLNAKYDLQ